MAQETDAIAICHVLGDGHDGLMDAIRAQRAITAALRAVFGALAESIPVFVATNRQGEDVSDCARAWGATEVRGYACGSVARGGGTDVLT